MNILHYLLDYRSGDTEDDAALLTHKILQEVKSALPQMSESDTNSDKHYTVKYDDLSNIEQHEHEGIMWGWQDCITKINEILS